MKLGKIKKEFDKRFPILQASAWDSIDARSDVKKFISEKIKEIILDYDKKVFGYRNCDLLITLENDYKALLEIISKRRKEALSRYILKGIIK